jgi:urease accessory protein
MRVNQLITACSVPALAFNGAPALAHHAMEGQTPDSLASGLLSGLAHPVIGLDHLLFLVVAAALISVFSRKAMFVLPGVFAASTVMGTIVHINAFSLSGAEIVIAVSVVAGGLLLLTRNRPNAWFMGTLLAGAGLFHGYAYGESIVGAEQTPLLAYLLGFFIVQYGVIIILSLTLARLRSGSSGLLVPVERMTGGLALAAGVFFLATGLM